MSNHYTPSIINHRTKSGKENSVTINCATCQRDFPAIKDAQGKVWVKRCPRCRKAGTTIKVHRRRHGQPKPQSDLTPNIFAKRKAQ